MIKNLVRSLQLIWPNRGMLVLFLIATAGEAVFGGAPLIIFNLLLFKLTNKTESNKIFKEGIQQINAWFEHVFGTGEGYLYGLCLVLAICFLIDAAFNLAADWLGGYIAQRTRINAMVKLMHHLLAMDMGFLDRRKTGDLVTRMLADINSLRTAVKVTLEFFRQPLTILVLAGVAIYCDPVLFLVGGVGLPLLVWPLIFITKKVYKQSRKMKEQTSDMTQAMLQNLSGMRIIHAYEAIEAERGNFSRLAEKLFKTAMKRNFNRALQQPITSIVLGLGGVCVILYGALRISRGELTPQDFFTFAGALAMLQKPIKSMLGPLGELAEMLPSAERTFEILDEQPKILDKPDARKAPAFAKALRFEGVSFDYGRGPVFEKLDLTIRCGQKIGIVGRTGVGKSTLLSLLLRFYDPVAGRITMDGTDLRDFTLASLRSQMGYVVQDPFLFHATVLDNIRYGRHDATEEQVVAAAKDAAVHDEIVALPNGYATYVGERGVLFSGGQRQRINIARALLRDAPILLLDEPTSALDAGSEHRVQEALNRLMAGRTSLIVAHRLSTIRECDAIVVFADAGGIEAVGSHAELLESSPTYRRLHEQQSGGENSPPQRRREDA